MRAKAFSATAHAAQHEQNVLTAVNFLRPCENPQTTPHNLMK